MSTRYPRLLILLLCIIALTACEGILDTTEPPAPILVTLPISTFTPTPAGGISPTPTSDQPTAIPPTATPTETPPPTLLPFAEGLGSARLLWEWEIVARPTALAPTGTRLAAIIADGRFAWLSAATGRVESSSFLWGGVLEGESWGEVYTDGSVAVVAARETSINTSTGIMGSRARLVVFDAEGNPMWELPELTGSQHFYSATLASGPGLVVVGKWPYSFEDNTLAGYELFSGSQLWQISEEGVGYQQMVHDGTRLYALLSSAEGGGVASYDLRTGEQLWQWSDEDVRHPDRILLHENSIYVLSGTRLVALDPLSGGQQWQTEFVSAAEAGIAAHDGLIYLAPAPTVELGFRPGIVAIQSGEGNLVWHSLSGLLADPLTAGDSAIWTVIKDFDTGQVWLSILEPESGLEQARIPIGDDTHILFQLVALGQSVYVLGDSLQAYGY